MKRGLARFWYKFKSLFRITTGPGEPLTFSCGSEEELRRVTTWACHIYPQVFGITRVADIIYKPADDHVKYARVLTLENRSVEECASVEPYYTWLDNLLRLVLYHNQFTGTHWICPFRNEPGFRNLPGLPNRIGIVEFGMAITVEVHPPSAHERAEALLALAEWLDGKVSEQEKRELLQLPEDVEI